MCGHKGNRRWGRAPGLHGALRADRRARAAGKTTTLQMLVGRVQPSGGGAVVRGGAARLGFCPQQDALLELLTGAEQLALYARLKARRVGLGFVKKKVYTCYARALYGGEVCEWTRWCSCSQAQSIVMKVHAWKRIRLRVSQSGLMQAGGVMGEACSNSGAPEAAGRAGVCCGGAGGGCAAAGVAAAGAPPALHPCRPRCAAADCPLRSASARAHAPTPCAARGTCKPRVCVHGPRPGRQGGGREGWIGFG